MAKSNTNISFSLLIPCYGDATHIGQMIKSVKNNFYKNYEIIICEQGNTNVLLDADENIKIIHLEKPSSYFSRLKLFSEAKGDYVWFLDDDDEIEENSLSIIASSILNTNYPDCILIKNVVFKNEIEFVNYERKNGVCIPKTLHKDDVIKKFINSTEINTVWGKIFKRSVCPKWVNNIDVFQSDDKLLSSAIIEASNSFVEIDIPLYKYFAYRSHSLKNTSFKKLYDSIEVKTYIASKYKNYDLSKLFFEGYLNIKSYLLSNKSIKKINKIYENCIINDFILELKANAINIKELLSDKDGFLFNCIISKNVFTIWLILVFNKKRSKKQIETYQHISLGFNCSTAYNLKENNLRTFSSPFDWTITFNIVDVIKLIDTKFANWLTKKYIYQDDVVPKWYLNKKTNVLFGHGFAVNDIFPIRFLRIKAIYKKRIKRFNKKIKNPTIFYRYCYMPEEIKFISENYEEIEAFFKKFNKFNKIIFIIDETLLKEKIKYPKYSIVCENIDNDWNKLKNDRNFKNFVSVFEKHNQNIKSYRIKYNNFIDKIFNRISRQKSPYKYKKQYKHFDVY